MLTVWPCRRRGFTLVELLVAIALLAILLSQAIPAWRSSTADSRARGAAESLQNALRQAQATAITRSRVAVLALTGAEPAWNAAPSANGSQWFSRLLPQPDSDEVADSASADSLLIQTSTLARQYGVSITGPALLCFNPLGQLTSLANTATGLDTACNAPTNDVSTPTEYTLARSGASRSFKVRVYLGGRIRMCDAAKTLSATDPDGC